MSFVFFNLLIFLLVLLGREQRESWGENHPGTIMLLCQGSRKRLWAFDKGNGLASHTPAPYDPRNTTGCPPKIGQRGRTGGQVLGRSSKIDLVDVPSF